MNTSQICRIVTEAFEILYAVVTTQIPPYPFVLLQQYFGYSCCPATSAHYCYCTYHSYISLSRFLFWIRIRLTTVIISSPSSGYEFRSFGYGFYLLKLLALFLLSAFLSARSCMCSLLWLHLGEEQYLLNEGFTSKKHYQAVDTNTNTTGRRHTVL